MLLKLLQGAYIFVDCGDPCGQKMKLFKQSELQQLQCQSVTFLNSSSAAVHKKSLNFI